MRIAINPNVMNFAPVARGTNRLEVRNEGDEHEIVLIGNIGKSFWDDTGITEKEVRDALRSIPKGKPITLKVNSEGGSVKEGLGIYNALGERSGDITARITGYALSIASVFPLAAGKVVSPDSAIWMMHKAWTYTQGNSDDMEQAAEMLAEHDEALAEIYAKHTGRPIQEMRDAMSKETWLRGSAAVEFGLADGGDDGDGDDESQACGSRPIAKAFLQRCKNIPSEILNLISAPVQGAGPGRTPGKPENQDSIIIMNRKKMIALLNKWGVKFDENATDEQLEALIEAGKPATLPQNNIPAAAPAVAASGNPAAQPVVAGVSLDAFNIEKKKRIKAEILRRAENKIPNDKLEWWINLAMSDEETVLAQIDALPVNNPGGDPVGNCAVVNEGEYDRISKLPTAKERFAAYKGDWDNIIQDCFRRDRRGEKPKMMSRYAAQNVAGYGLPQNANTLSATITTSFLLDGAVTNLQNQWAPLMVFTRDFSTDPYKPKATAVLKNVTATGVVLKNATNFEQGGDTIAPISITVDQYSKPFSVSNTDLNSGLRMENLITVNSAGIANSIIETAVTPITAANFNTLAALTKDSATFGFGDLTTLWGLLKKSGIKNALLDGEYMAKLLNIPTFFQAAAVAPGGGWRGFGWDYLALNTDWTTADPKVRGFACNPQAIIAVAGLPLTPPEGIPGNTLQMATAQVPEIGITIAAFSWFNLASRTAFMSYDLMFGAQKGDTTAGVILFNP